MLHRTIEGECTRCFIETQSSQYSLQLCCTMKVSLFFTFLFIAPILLSLPHTVSPLPPATIHDHTLHNDKSLIINKRITSHMC